MSGCKSGAAASARAAVEKAWAEGRIADLDEFKAAGAVQLQTFKKGDSARTIDSTVVTLAGGRDDWSCTVTYEHRGRVCRDPMSRRAIVLPDTPHPQLLLDVHEELRAHESADR